MKIDIDELGPVQRKIRVELPAETVASEFSRAYKNLGQRVRVKGFRTGKIPRNVLQGIYGDDIVSEVRSHLVEETLGEVIKHRGLQIVSRPEVESQDLHEGNAFAFSAVFEVKPQIEIKDYLGVEVEKVKVAVTDAQVDEALHRLQESHASLELVKDREVVQKGDFVTLDFNGTSGGNPFSGGKGENYALEVGAGNALPQFESAVDGAKIGDQRTAQVDYPDNYLNKEIAGKTVEFSLVVREIKQKVLPQLDDEFAKDHGEHGSLDELRAAIRKRLEDELRHYQDEQLKEQVLSRLIESHSFTIPQSMVERQTRYLMERYQSQMARSPERKPSPRRRRKKRGRALEARAARQVQATLLVERIAELEKIEIADKDIQERIDSSLALLANGRKVCGSTIRAPDARDDLRAQLMFDRTVGLFV